MLLSFAWLSCSFDTSQLDTRRCESSSDCTSGFTCVAGFCQSGSDFGDDVDVAGEDMEDPFRCTDEDDDSFFGGAGCETPSFDCNDFNDDVFPGAPETCDLNDNDCDGLVDAEDPDYDDPRQDCPLTEGVCAGTIQECVRGLLQDCTPETYGENYALVEEGNLELCDDMDNDCDGETDELIFEVCYDGDQSELRDDAPCAEGLVQCVEGSLAGDCEGQVLPVTEDIFETRCDSVDNDCDGNVDPLCSCQPGEERSCYSLEDRSFTENPPCLLGRRICTEDAVFGDCMEEVLPEPETCGNPGVDNDCDGDDSPEDIEVEINPGVFVSFGDACTTTELGVCAPGTYQCEGGDLVCVRNVDPTPETCANPGSNDDCDAQTDNIPGLNEMCLVTRFMDTDIFGTCRQGSYECDGVDRLICMPGSSVPNDLVCDNLDGDCDGLDDLTELAVELETSPVNCGSCGVTCMGPTPDCCAVTSDSAGIQGGCIDLSSDVHFCLDCGTDCTGMGHDNPGCCGTDGCVDLDDDPDNCGTCGFDCDPGDICCGGECFDPSVSLEHCGGCSNEDESHACDADTEHCCSDGGGGFECADLDDPACCGTGESDCGGNQDCCLNGAGTDFVCANLNANPNCGGCGVACSSFGADFGCCESPIGACFDGTTSLTHCGSCGNSCLDDGHTSPGCCETTVDNYDCTDRIDDNNNCGACGVVCDGAEQCCGGQCVPDSSINNCGGCGVVCGANQGCCDNGAGGFACVNLSTGIDLGGDNDIDHCGTCGTTCGTGSNFACCSGLCVNTDDNNTHCDDCFQPCMVFMGQLCCDGSGGMMCRNAGDCD